MGVAGNLDLRQGKQSFGNLSRARVAAEQRLRVACNQADRHRQIRIGLDRLAQDHLGREHLLFAIAFHLSDVVPTIAVDLAEIQPPPRHRSHVGYREPFVAHGELKKLKRIEQPTEPVGIRIERDGEILRGKATAFAGRDHHRTLHTGSRWRFKRQVRAGQFGTQRDHRKTRDDLVDLLFETDHVRVLIHHPRAER